MEYVYAALLLNAVGAQVSEDGVKKVLISAGAKPDESRIKALVAALDGVDIKEAISKAAPVAAAAAPAQAPAGGAKAPEAKKEEKVSEEEAAAGLGALFG
ncbi:MAG TPA: 50S ribosomal protein P1 [Candidatus Nanoarchaeia archaeon]|nr:50S ribosomal protein P1 [Candidatus Nanoarchaeia archaeon]